MKAVLIGPESCPYVNILRSKLTTLWELVCIENDEQTAGTAAHLANADALISIRFDASLPPMPALRLLQTPSAGTNSIELQRVPAHVQLCNAYGHEVAIAEYSVLGMLLCAHEVFSLHAGFRSGCWLWSQLPMPPLHTEIFRKTVCIIGMGRIGLETARRTRAMGMYVIGCNRTRRPAPDVDEIVGLQQIAASAARADFVVVNCALTDETRHIIDAKVLRAMKSTGFIINVGRGGLIEEQALYRALSERWIAGAVLDVWYRYPSDADPHPRPSRFDFHELDNVIMTPHASGMTDGMVERRWTQIARNLDSLAMAKSLMNLIAH